MTSVSTADLKAHLGHYLQSVRNGETVEVTSHRHAVARLVPCAAGSRVGVIGPTRPMADLKRVQGLKSGKRADGFAELLRDRARR
jgi:prevent-host-death family protein